VAGEFLYIKNNESYVEGSFFIDTWRCWVEFYEVVCYDRCFFCCLWKSCHPGSRATWRCSQITRNESLLQNKDRSRQHHPTRRPGRLHLWSKTWQLKFNADKCKVMHIGHSCGTKILYGRERRNFLFYTTENMLPNDNVSVSVGHLDHVLIVYSSMEHVTWKSPGPICGWVGKILHPDSCTSVSSWSKISPLSIVLSLCLSAHLSSTLEPVFLWRGFGFHFLDCVPSP